MPDNWKITYKETKKRYKITDADIASAFGYKSVGSFRRSARYEYVVKGVIYCFTRKEQHGRCK